MVKKLSKLEDLQPNPKNHNKGKERGNWAIEESIRRLGAGRSGVCDANGVVLAGNSTLQKISELGIEVQIVPTDGTKWVVVQRTDLDVENDPKATELAYADNRTSQLNFELDVEQLKLDIEDDVDLSFLWTEEELRIELNQGDELLDEDDEEEKDSNGTGEPTQPRPDLELGSIWQIGRHYLGCGDSTDELFVREVLAGHTPDMVFADGPYGVKAASSYADGKPKKGLAMVKRNKFEDIAGDNSTDTVIAAYELLSRLFPNAVHIWWGANYFSQVLPPSSCWIIWDKEQTSNFADAELAWTNQTSAVRIFRHQWNGMLKASERGEQRIHPTQKPCALFSWTLDKYGSTNDIVLDPFCGSGMSIVAAEECGATVFGVEISIPQVERTLQRLERKLGVMAERIN